MDNQQTSSTLKVLIMTAVEAERQAVLRGLDGAASFHVELAGVGPVAAAVSAARLLEAAAARGESYAAVVSAGIGGGYEGQAEIGSVVVSSRIVAADLGAETPEGFCDLDGLGFGSASIPVEAGLVEKTARTIAASGLAVHTGPALTLATVTGTAATAAAIATRITGAASEGMEGFGIAAAAQSFGLPALEIRAISNAVGPRDKSKWQIGKALQALETASQALREVWK